MRKLFVILIIAIFPLTASADAVKIDNLWYNLNNSELTAEVIKSQDENVYRGEIVIPSNVDYNSVQYLVKSIGESAFKECYNISSVTFSEGLEIINDSAFCSCWSVRFGSFPSSLVSIGKWAFFNCNNIKELNLPEKCQYIGEYAFYSCYGLTKVRSSSLVNIEDHAFYHCNNLHTVELPSTLNSIKAGAFSECDNLSIVISHLQDPFAIDSSVFGTFYNTSWDEAGNATYNYTPSPAVLYVPTGTKAKYESYKGWNLFADIVEDELKEAFVDGLLYSYLTTNKTAIVSGKSGSQRKITIPTTVSIDGVSYSVQSIGNSAFRESDIDTLIISPGIVAIDNYAFNQCRNLKKIDFPSTLKTIGKNAFEYCEALQIITLPLLTSIGEYAFYRCSNLFAVVSKIQSPFEINKNVFAPDWPSYEDGTANYPKPSAKLYVPKDLKDEYQAIEGWNVFEEIIEGELKEATIDGLNYSYVEGSSTATLIWGNYSEMTEVAIPASINIEGNQYDVKTIGIRAFRNCSKLKKVEIGTGIENIEKSVFIGCYSLESVTIPEGVTSIGDGAFASSGKQAKPLSITLPSTIRSLGSGIFRYAKLASITSKILVPFDISDDTFVTGSDDNDKGSAVLYVPEGTLALYQAIKGWTMFANIYEGEMLEAVVDGLKYNYTKSTKTATVIAGDYSEMTSVVIPASVTIEGVEYQVKEIGTSAFLQCGDIRNISISDGIEIIGKYAFQSCYSAEFDNLPSSIVTIGEYAFYNCNSIKDLEIPEGVQTIGACAFEYCHGLMKLVLPSTITDIGRNAFTTCDKLVSVTSHIVEPPLIEKEVFTILNWNQDLQQTIYSPSGARLYVPEGTLAKYQAIEGWTMFAGIYEGEILEAQVGDLKYSYSTGQKTATVVRGENYSELTKVTIPSTVEIDGETYQVKDIATQAFYNTPITSVVFSEGIETIGQESFYNCLQLTSITLPSSLTTIGDRAFANCRTIKTLEIPSGLTKMGECVFSWCSGLSSIEVSGGNTVFESNGSNAIIEKDNKTLIIGCSNTTIPSGVEVIGAESFCNLNIKDIIIPNTVKRIGNNAFSSCRFLAEIILPEGVEAVGSNAFYNCEKLVSITFPNSLKSFGDRMLSNCYSLQNIVSYIDNPSNLRESVFEEINNSFGDITLWVPKGKTSTYQGLEGWNSFTLIEEMLGDILKSPTVSYNGHYLTMTNDKEQKASIYYSVDGTAPSILYNDTVAISNLGTIMAISKRFGSYTVDTTRYEITYVYDGVTARTASGGLLAKAFEWCGTNNIEMLDIVGTLNDEDFGTIRSLSKLNTLNMAASKIANDAIPSEAFANTKLRWYASPYTITSVGSNIFKDCQELAAITWNCDKVKLPNDVVTDVANPNMLVYAKDQATIPYALKNVIVEGVANNIILADSAGNNNFYCPEAFMARRISYTHNYQQPTVRGTTQGWETLALPFSVSKITHETKGEITPSAVEGAERPFWLYELGDNGLKAATEIKANIPYLISMPNDDAYGDEYILGGRVTFSAQNVTITTSGGTTISQGDRQFVPTYKAVGKADGVYALNVGEVYNGNPMGSVFVQNYREVRPFEAYSVHSGSRSRTIPVSSLGGGDTTGIHDLMLKNGDDADSVVKVYSLSGALVKQGKREETLRSLPKGLYIINGKKIIK